MADEAPDLLAFEDAQLYFDEPQSAAIDALLGEAAAEYGRPAAEHALMRAYFLAPRQLAVLVALYRYYYYQHRLEDALLVAERAMDVAGERLALVNDWRGLRPDRHRRRRLPFHRPAALLSAGTQGLRDHPAAHGSAGRRTRSPRQDQ